MNIKTIVKARLVFKQIALKKEREKAMNDWSTSGVYLCEMRYHHIRTIDEKLKLIEELKEDFDKFFDNKNFEVKDGSDD